MSFTTETASILYSEPTGYTNGYGYVDLGLPSGTRWATCNVGANSPAAYGNYYAWGETTPKDTYTWTNYRFRTSGDNWDNVQFSKYNTSSSHGLVDNLNTLEASDDAATANWGSGWRMPTSNELNELKNNCTVTYTSQNGVNGCLFTSRTNGNSIFLPAAGLRNDSSLRNDGSRGNYWSISLNASAAAWYLFFYPDHCSRDGEYRYTGLTVRAVCQSQN